MEDIPMPFSTENIDGYVAQKKMESSLRKESIAAVKARREDVEGMQPKGQIMMNIGGYTTSAPVKTGTYDYGMLSRSVVVGMTEDYAAFVEQGLADEYPEFISAEETAIIMKQWLMGTAGVSKSLSFG
jgi:hypothetical protein